MVYRIRRFNAVFTRTFNNPYPEPNQPNSSYLYIFWRSILILAFHLRLGLPKDFFPVSLHSLHVFRCRPTASNWRYLRTEKNSRLHMNVPSTSPPKEISRTSLVYPGKIKVRYFLNTPCITHCCSRQTVYLTAGETTLEDASHRWQWNII